MAEKFVLLMVVAAVVVSAFVAGLWLIDGDNGDVPVVGNGEEGSEEYKDYFRVGEENGDTRISLMYGSVDEWGAACKEEPNVTEHRGSPPVHVDIGCPVGEVVVVVVDDGSSYTIEW